MNLTLGFSPCPNDTFIFDALVHGKIDTGDLGFDYVLEDVETLNRWAAEGKLDVTKLSYSALLKVMSHYALLSSGGALGRGVGPLLVTHDKNNISEKNLGRWLSQAHIAIPGGSTTANLLLTLAFPDAKQKTEVVFHEIEAVVAKQKFDAGLLIHEGRFTYRQKGLRKLLDLGDWWEKTTGCAIPLGGIAIKRSLGTTMAARVNTLIVESLRYAQQTYPSLAPFVRQHAQEMDEEVMRKHIELYVNDYSMDLGKDGEKAVLTLFDKAKKAGIIEGFAPEQIFATH